MSDFIQDEQQSPVRLGNVLFGQSFVRAFESFQVKVHQNAKEHGFHEQEHHNGYYIAHLHGEISEAWEALRQGNPPSDHIPEFTGLEEELADVVIRAMDMAQVRGVRLAQAILAKHIYNINRPYKHGKQF